MVSFILVTFRQQVWDFMLRGSGKSSHMSKQISLNSIHISFSENFSLTEQNAVQSPHWTNNQCTLFTVHLRINKNVSQSLMYVSHFFFGGVHSMQG